MRKWGTMDDVLDNNIKDDGQDNQLRSGQSPSGTMESSQSPSESNDNSPFPTAEELLSTLRKRQQAAGRAGGLSRSQSKRDATRRNIAKARLSRWPGREAANRGRELANEQTQISNLIPNSSRNSDNGDES
jgi:hypothetical protein